TAVLYAMALLWYGLKGHKAVLSVAPEEVAARIAAKFSGNADQPQPASGTPPVVRHTHLERLTAILLVVGLGSLARMLLEAADWLPGWLWFGHGVLADIGVWSGLFGLVSAVGLASLRRNR